LAPSGLSLATPPSTTPRLPPPLLARFLLTVDPEWSGPLRESVEKRLQYDETANLAFLHSFGRDLTKEEAYIAKLDSSTGASLKLTVLNAEGRVWTMVAGGGASVVYS
jgi:hypothetical protein